MQTASILVKKREGAELSQEEISHLIAGFVEGSVSDDQMAAFAMAVCIRGMSTAETMHLTRDMLHSGTVLSWEQEERPIVDKHSTGGVGDKVSLLLAPLLACENVVVPMISGRGLGPTGGTLDKLEAIPGFRTNLSLTEVQSIAREVGCVITGATPEIAPADGRLYALRDVTGTVESIPLITASILSKKLAAGLQALVLDVKCGNGAFMKTLSEAQALAKSLIQTGTRMGVNAVAYITDMNQPLGRMVGNGVEVDESLAALQGTGPADLLGLTLTLAGELLLAVGLADSIVEAETRLAEHLTTGRAHEKFEQMVAAQGGDIHAYRPRAPARELVASQSGFVNAMETRSMGLAVIEMGGGRKLRTDPIDHSVGFEKLVSLGEKVDRGQPLLRVFASEEAYQRALPYLEHAITIGDSRLEPPPNVYEIVRSDR